MRELDIISPESLDVSERDQLMLLVYDEKDITCVNLRELKGIITEVGIDAILVMPDYQCLRGKRGWAKAQILASLTQQLKGVMPLDYETFKRELDQNWFFVRTEAPINLNWDEPEQITAENIKLREIPIEETNEPFDIEMMTKAKNVAETSNCWLDPAGCVFVKEGEVVLMSVSTGFNNPTCKEIPINFKDLELNPGERMLFCDSVHAERVGISQAVTNGISLVDSTLYVTKFPCYPCSQEIITAGIKSVVFERGSYGLIDAYPLLVENGIELKRVKF